VLTRHAITRRADADGVDATVVERDSALAHIVAQPRCARPEDGGRLVFKGGSGITSGSFTSPTMLSDPISTQSTPALHL
jgi:hypothetical protein